jgi:hypothetical protein
MTYQTSNDSSQVEYHPEPTDVLSFGFLRGIRHHDGTLRCPQNSRAPSKEDARKDCETIVVIVTVAQEGSNVNRVAQTAEGQCNLNANHVGERACKETDYCKSRVQGHVCVICRLLVLLSTTSHSREGIEHARTKEAHESDDQELNLRRRIARDGVRTDSPCLVSPSSSLRYDTSFLSGGALRMSRRHSGRRTLFLVGEVRHGGE